MHILHFNFVGQTHSHWHPLYWKLLDIWLLMGKVCFPKTDLPTTCWTLPLAGRSGYVTKDKINPTMKLTIMVTFDIGMLYRITKIHFHSHSITLCYNDSTQYKMLTSHRQSFQILLMWLVRSVSSFSMLY